MMKFRLAGRQRLRERLTFSSLKKLAKRNIAHYPQVACFSFDVISAIVNIQGRFERDTLDATFAFLEANEYLRRGFALDVGANIGNHSLYFAGKFSKVFSFEPNPRVFEILKINSKLFDNIFVYKFGISDFSGELCFKENLTNIGSSFVFNAEENYNNLKFVKVERLDDLEFLKDSKIALIKIDVEGHEEQVINGGRELIKLNMPVIIFEQAADEIYDGGSRTTRALRELGYKFFILNENFDFGSGKYKILLSKLFKDVFGASCDVLPVSEFDRRFYEMIIAVPDQ